MDAIGASARNGRSAIGRRNAPIGRNTVQSGRRIVHPKIDATQDENQLSRRSAK